MSRDRISVSRLSVVYGNVLHALNEVSFSLEDGMSLDAGFDNYTRL